MLREELQLLQEQGSLVGEVVKAMDKKKVLVKVRKKKRIQNLDFIHLPNNFRFIPKVNLLLILIKISIWQKLHQVVVLH